MSATATHLLDTSVYSQPLRKRPLQGVIDHWSSRGDQALCTSTVCEAEVLYGLQLRGSPRLWQAYRSILVDRIPVIDVDHAVAHAYAEIAAEAKQRGRPVPALDILIAATAKAHELVLATCNVKHFKQLAGIAVEDWSR